MIRKRKRPPMQYMEVLTIARPLLLNQTLEVDQIQVLLSVWYLQTITNKPINRMEIKAFLKMGLKNVSENITQLHALGYLQRVVNDQLLTTKGEYFIKGLEIEAGRLIDSYRALKWHNPKNVDPRLMFPAAKKGAKFY